MIGSCAANISLILGITALIRPPSIDGRLIRREVPVLLGSAIAVPLLFRNGVLSRLEGALLVACAIVFTIATLTVAARLDPDAADADHDDNDPMDSAASSSIRVTRTELSRAAAEESGADLGGKGRPRTGKLVAALLSAFGVVLLVLGSNVFVRGGRGIAGEVGMSERMLGLTVIAIGTALPELIGSIVAASRGQAALAIGSVIGSNILNVFLVLGVTAYLRPIHAGELLHLPEMIGLVGITLLGVVMLRGSRKISRIEGAILVLAYVAFIATAAIF